MTRDVASRFNPPCADVCVARSLTREATMYVPGLDGGNVRSRDNTLNIFDELAVEKRINKEIVTDATPWRTLHP